MVTPVIILFLLTWPYLTFKIMKKPRERQEAAGVLGVMLVFMPKLCDTRG